MLLVASVELDTWRRFTLFLAIRYLPLTEIADFVMWRRLLRLLIGSICGTSRESNFE